MCCFVLDACKTTRDSGHQNAPGTNISNVAYYVGGDNKLGMFIRDGGAWFDYATDGKINKWTEITAPGSDFIQLQFESQPLFVRLYKTEAFLSGQKGEPGRHLYGLNWRLGGVK